MWYLFPGDKYRGCHRKGEKVQGYGKGGSILVHVGTNNTEKGTTVIAKKYSKPGTG